MRLSSPGKVPPVPSRPSRRWGLCRFLVFSDVKKNRIWRWEEGGGLFTIGKSLFLDRSGCRTDPNLCATLIEPGEPQGSLSKGMVKGRWTLGLEAVDSGWGGCVGVWS
jgi:hypothetical protein